MQRGRRIVAAALGGGAVTALTVAALALGAGAESSALVTLQVAPRGPGSVSAVPAPSAGDPHPCTGHDAENDCEWSYEQGTSVRLNAVVDSGRGEELLRLERARLRHEQLVHRPRRRPADVRRRPVRPVDAGREVLRQRRRRDRVGQPCRGAVRSGRGARRRDILPRLPAAHARRADRDGGHDAVPGLERAGRLSLRAHERGHVHDRGRGSADLGRGAVRERAAAAAGDDDQRRVQAAQSRQRQRPRHGVEAGLRHGLHGQLRLRQADHADREPGRRLALRRLERGLRADPADLQLPGRPDHLDPGCVHQGRDGADDARHARDR